MLADDVPIGVNMSIAALVTKLTFVDLKELAHHGLRLVHAGEGKRLHPYLGPYFSVH